MSTQTVDRAEARERALRALQRANDVRLKRAELTRRIRAGEQPLAPLVLDPPDELRTLPVWKLLTAVPRFGHMRANRLLARVPVSPSRELGALTERQRSALVGALPETTKARTR